MRDVKERLEQGFPIRPQDFVRASGLPRSTVYKAIMNGDLETTRMGGAILIPARVALKAMGMLEPSEKAAA